MWKTKFKRSLWLLAWKKIGNKKLFIYGNISKYIFKLVPLFCHLSPVYKLRSHLHYKPQRPQRQSTQLCGKMMN